MKTTKIIIAIDGHSSTGKSSFAKRVAAMEGYIYIDTGALYRASTLFAMRNNLIKDDNTIEENILKEKLKDINLSFKINSKSGQCETYINDENVETLLRSMVVSDKVSYMAAVPTIRDYVNVVLRRIGADKGVVMDGRDIGTVVFPNAELKIFMTADPKIRAMRRLKEMKAKGEDANFEEVLKNINDRDFIDSNRSKDPLRRASESILLDNSNMSLEEELVWIKPYIESAKQLVSKKIKKVVIDEYSGCCPGVEHTIERAEGELSKYHTLFSLGAIVHNDVELKRLAAQGLDTIDYSKYHKLSNKKVLIRAHGEPPTTYEYAKTHNLDLVDCTCPVVLKLQKKILETYNKIKPHGGQIVIFGKIGHAEVNGLVGQVNSDAFVIEHYSELYEDKFKKRIDLSKPIAIFSQTTKSTQEYNKICSELKKMVINDNLQIFNTICHRVSGRHDSLIKFAHEMSVIIFVCGKESSNGKILCDLCKANNERTYRVDDENDINPNWFIQDEKVGVCGATSTPRWQLDKVAKFLISL